MVKAYFVNDCLAEFWNNAVVLCAWMIKWALTCEKTIIYTYTDYYFELKTYCLMAITFPVYWWNVANMVMRRNPGLSGNIVNEDLPRNGPT